MAQTSKGVTARVKTVHCAPVPGQTLMIITACPWERGTDEPLTGTDKAILRVSIKSILEELQYATIKPKPRHSTMAFDVNILSTTKCME